MQLEESELKVLKAIVLLYGEYGFTPNGLKKVQGYTKSLVTKFIEAGFIEVTGKSFRVTTAGSEAVQNITL